jgi:hypothetical protein
MSDVEYDRAAAYHAVKSLIWARTVDGTQNAIREQQVKLTMCDHGSLTIEQVDTALRALGEQHSILYGSGWITPVVDGPWLRDAIEHVVPKEDEPEEFVAVCNNYLM